MPDAASTKSSASTRRQSASPMENEEEAAEEGWRKVMKIFSDVLDPNQPWHLKFFEEDDGPGELHAVQDVEDENCWPNVESTSTTRQDIECGQIHEKESAYGFQNSSADFPNTRQKKKKQIPQAITWYKLVKMLILHALPAGNNRMAKLRLLLWLLGKYDLVDMLMPVRKVAGGVTPYLCWLTAYLLEDIYPLGIRILHKPQWPHCISFRTTEFPSLCPMEKFTGKTTSAPTVCLWNGYIIGSNYYNTANANVEFEDVKDLSS
jgi:hypothetical protein